MLHNFESRFAECWPVEGWCDVTVLVAISGGADSVALLRAMLGLKKSGVGRLCAAHFNHRLRPEADADEQFVRELCANSKISCEFGRAEASQIASMQGEGIEEAARRLRYDFLRSTAGRLGARYTPAAIRAWRVCWSSWTSCASRAKASRACSRRWRNRGCPCPSWSRTPAASG